jgi:hypothetical protein
MQLCGEGAEAAKGGCNGVQLNLQGNMYVCVLCVCVCVCVCVLVTFEAC